jgi:hypothetical protein
MAPRVVNTPRDPAHNPVRAKEATVDTLIIRTPTPEVLPGDTLETHYSGLERMRPRGCYEGFVFIGHLVVDEDGEPQEVIERMPCRRCTTQSV